MKQQAKMIISCRAPYGSGGLGRHFLEVVEEARREGCLVRYYSKAIKPDDEHLGRTISIERYNDLLNLTPLRFSPAWRYHLIGVAFDRAVAATLTREGDVFVGFLGASLESYRKARALKMEGLVMQAVNSHVSNIRRLHDLARRRYGIEHSWMNNAHLRRGLKEYAMADVIYCNSAYTLETFQAEGVDASKLKRTWVQPHPRFLPPMERKKDGIFRVVYTGSISVAKGIPVLLEAFHRLQDEHAELTLVGHWTSRGMGRFMRGWMARDRRIRHAPGDPLPHYHRADVCVHPTFEDGFGYAPAEALACGVPVVVTADTGMKELVREGENGWVIPTGDVDALYERLEALHRVR